MSYLLLPKANVPLEMNKTQYPGCNFRNSRVVPLSRAVNAIDATTSEGISPASSFPSK
jgi:hypothetical protein